ncbi:MAG: hypothetical protein D6735_10620, partial [Acidobacteria bacterium]
GGTVGTATRAAVIGGVLQAAQDQYDIWRTTVEDALRIGMGGITNVVGAGTIGNIARDGILRYIGRNVATDIMAGFLGGAGVELTSAIVGQEGFKPEAGDVLKAGALSSAMAATTGVIVSHIPTLYKEWRTERKIATAATQAVKQQLKNYFGSLDELLSETNANYSTSADRALVSEFLTRVDSIADKPKRYDAWLQEINSEIEKHYAETIGKSQTLSTLYGAIIDTGLAATYYKNIQTSTFAPIAPTANLQTIGDTILEPAFIAPLGDYKRIQNSKIATSVAIREPIVTAAEKKIAEAVARDIVSLISASEPELLKIPEVSETITEAVLRSYAIARRGYRSSVTQPNYVHFIASFDASSPLHYVLTKYVTPVIDLLWNTRVSVDSVEVFEGRNGASKIAQIQDTVQSIIDARNKTIDAQFPGFKVVVDPASLKSLYMDAFDEFSSYHGRKLDNALQAKFDDAAKVLNAISKAFDGILYRDQQGVPRIWLHAEYSPKRPSILRHYVELGDVVRSVEDKVFRGNAIGYDPGKNFLFMPAETRLLFKQISNSQIPGANGKTPAQIFHNALSELTHIYLYGGLDPADVGTHISNFLDHFYNVVQYAGLENAIKNISKFIPELEDILTNGQAAVERILKTAAEAQKKIRADYTQQVGKKLKTDIDIVNYLNQFEERALQMITRYLNRSKGVIRTITPWLRRIVNEEYNIAIEHFAQNPKVAVRLIVDDNLATRIRIPEVISKYVEKATQKTKPVVKEEFPATSYPHPLGILSSLTHQVKTENWGVALRNVTFQVLPETDRLSLRLGNKTYELEYTFYPDRRRDIPEIIDRYWKQTAIPVQDRFFRALAHVFTGQEFTDTGLAIDVLRRMKKGISQRFNAVYDIVTDYVQSAAQAPEYYNNRFTKDFERAFIGNFRSWVQAVAGRTYKDYRTYTKNLLSYKIDKDVINAFQKLESVVGIGLKYSDIHDAIAEGDYTFLTKEIIENPALTPFIGSMLRLSLVINPTIRITEELVPYLDDLHFIFDDNILARPGGVDILRSMGAKALKLWAAVDKGVTRYLEMNGLVEPRPDVPIVEIPTEEAGLREFMRTNYMLPSGEPIYWITAPIRDILYSAKVDKNEISLGFIDFNAIRKPVDIENYPYDISYVRLPKDADRYFEEQYRRFQEDPYTFIRDLLWNPVVVDTSGYIVKNIHTYYLLERFPEIREMYYARVSAFSRFFRKGGRGPEMSGEAGTFTTPVIRIRSAAPLRDSTLRAILGNEEYAALPRKVFSQRLEDFIDEYEPTPQQRTVLGPLLTEFFFAPSEKALRTLSRELFGEHAEDLLLRQLEATGKAVQTETGVYDFEETLRRYPVFINTIFEVSNAIREYANTKYSNNTYPDEVAVNRRIQEFSDLRYVRNGVVDIASLQYNSSKKTLPDFVAWVLENKRSAKARAVENYTIQEYLAIRHEYEDAIIKKKEEEARLKEIERLRAAEERARIREEKKKAKELERQRRAEEKAKAREERKKALEQAKAEREKQLEEKPEEAGQVRSDIGAKTSLLLQSRRLQKMKQRTVSPSDDTTIPTPEAETEKTKKGGGGILKRLLKDEEITEQEGLDALIERTEKSKRKRKRGEGPPSSPDVLSFVDPVTVAGALIAVADEYDSEDSEDENISYAGFLGLMLLGGNIGRKLRLRFARVPLTLGKYAKDVWDVSRKLGGKDKEIKRRADDAITKTFDALRIIGSALAENPEVEGRELASYIEQITQDIQTPELRNLASEFIGKRFDKLMARPELYAEFIGLLGEQSATKVQRAIKKFAKYQPIEIPPLNLSPEKSWGTIMFGYKTRIGHMLGDIWDTAGVDIYGFLARRLLHPLSEDFSTVEAKRIVEDAILSHFPSIRIAYADLLKAIGLDDIVVPSSAREERLSNDRTAIRTLLTDLFLSWIDPALRPIQTLALKYGDEFEAIQKLYLKIWSASPLLIYFHPSTRVQLDLFNAINIGLDIVRTGESPLIAVAPNSEYREWIGEDAIPLYTALWDGKKKSIDVELSNLARRRIADKDIGYLYRIDETWAPTTNLTESQQTFIAGIRSLSKNLGAQKSIENMTAILQEIPKSELGDIIQTLSTDTLLLAQARNLFELYQSPLFAEREKAGNYVGTLGEEIEDLRRVWERSMLTKDVTERYPVTPEMLEQNPRLRTLVEAEQRRNELSRDFQSKLEENLQKQEIYKSYLEGKTEVPEDIRVQLPVEEYIEKAIQEQKAAGKKLTKKDKANIQKEVLEQLEGQYQELVVEPQQKKARESIEQLRQEEIKIRNILEFLRQPIYDIVERIRNYVETISNFKRLDEKEGVAPPTITQEVIRQKVEDELSAREVARWNSLVRTFAEHFFARKANKLSQLEKKITKFAASHQKEFFDAIADYSKLYDILTLGKQQEGEPPERLLETFNMFVQKRRMILNYLVDKLQQININVPGFDSEKSRPIIALAILYKIAGLGKRSASIIDTILNSPEVGLAQEYKKKLRSTLSKTKQKKKGSNPLKPTKEEGEGPVEAVEPEDGINYVDELKKELEEVIQATQKLGDEITEIKGVNSYEHTLNIIASRLIQKGSSEYQIEDIEDAIQEAFIHLMELPYTDPATVREMLENIQVDKSGTVGILHLGKVNEYFHRIAFNKTRDVAKQYTKTESLDALLTGKEEGDDEELTLKDKIPASMRPEEEVQEEERFLRQMEALSKNAGLSPIDFELGMRYLSEGPTFREQIVDILKENPELLERIDAAMQQMHYFQMQAKRDVISPAEYLEYLLTPVEDEAAEQARKELLSSVKSGVQVYAMQKAAQLGDIYLNVLFRREGDVEGIVEPTYTAIATTHTRYNEIQSTIDESLSIYEASAKRKAALEPLEEYWDIFVSSIGEWYEGPSGRPIIEESMFKTIKDNLSRSYKQLSEGASWVIPGSDETYTSRDMVAELLNGRRSAEGSVDVRRAITQLRSTLIRTGRNLYKVNAALVNEYSDSIFPLFVEREVLPAEEGAAIAYIRELKNQNRLLSQYKVHMGDGRDYYVLRYIRTPEGIDHLLSKLTSDKAADSELRREIFTLLGADPDSKVPANSEMLRNSLLRLMRSADKYLREAIGESSVTDLSLPTIIRLYIQQYVSDLTRYSLGYMVKLAGWGYADNSLRNASLDKYYSELIAYISDAKTKQELSFPVYWHNNISKLVQEKGKIPLVSVHLPLDIAAVNVYVEALANIYNSLNNVRAKLLEHHSNAVAILDDIERNPLGVNVEDINAIRAQYLTGLTRDESRRFQELTTPELQRKTLHGAQIVASQNLNWHLEQLRRSIYPPNLTLTRIFDDIMQAALQGKSILIGNLDTYIESLIGLQGDSQAIARAVEAFASALPKYFPNIKLKETKSGKMLVVPGYSKPIPVENLQASIRYVLPKTWEYIGIRSLIEQLRSGGEDGPQRVEQFFDKMRSFITSAPAIKRYGDPQNPNWEAEVALGRMIHDYSFPELAPPQALSAAKLTVSEFYKALREAGIRRHPASIAGDIAGEWYSNLLLATKAVEPNTAPITPVNSRYISPETGFTTMELARGLAQALRSIESTLREKGIELPLSETIPIVKDLLSIEGRKELYSLYVLPRPETSIGILRFMESLYKYAEHYLNQAMLGEEAPVQSLIPQLEKLSAEEDVRLFTDFMIARFAADESADASVIMDTLKRVAQGKPSEKKKLAERAEKLHSSLEEKLRRGIPEIVAQREFRAGIPVSQLIAAELVRRNAELGGIRLPEEVRATYDLYPALYEFARSQKPYLHKFLDAAQLDSNVQRALNAMANQLKTSPDTEHTNIVQQTTADIASVIEDTYLRSLSAADRTFVPNFVKPESYKAISPNNLHLYTLGALLAYELGWGNQDNDEEQQYVHAAILALSGSALKSFKKLTPKTLPYVIGGQTAASSATRLAAGLILANIYGEEIEKLTGMNRAQINSILIPLFGGMMFHNHFRVKALTRGDVEKRVSKNIGFDFTKINKPIYLQRKVYESILEGTGNIKPDLAAERVAQSILMNDNAQPFLRTVEKFLFFPENSLNRRDILARLIMNINEGTIKLVPLAQGAIAGTNALQSAIGQHIARGHIIEKQTEQAIFGLNVLTGAERFIPPPERTMRRRAGEIFGPDINRPDWYTNAVGSALANAFAPLPEDLPFVAAYAAAMHKAGAKEGYARFQQWLGENKKTRNAELALIGKFAVELDKATTEYINSDLPIEQLPAFVHSREETFFRANEAAFPNISITYYAYRAMNDLASATQLRMAAMYMLRPDTFTPIHQLPEALKEMGQKVQTLQEAIGEIDRKLEYASEGEVVTLTEMRNILSKLAEDMLARAENAHATVKLAQLSSIRRYISRWHHLRGNYKLRWKENIGGKIVDKMMLFETYDQLRDYQNKLLAQRGGAIIPSSAQIVEPGATEVEKLLTGDYLDLMLPGIVTESAIHSAESKAFSSVFHEEAIQSTIGAISKLANDYLGQPDPNAQENLGKYIVRKLNELETILREAGKLTKENIQKIQAAKSSIQAGDVKGIVELLTDRSFSVLTTEFSTLMRKMTDPLKQRTDVRGYDDILQTDEDYRNFIITGIASMLHKAGSAQSRLYKLSILEQAAQILGAFGLTGSPIGEKIKEATLRIKVPALNPLTMGATERYSVAARWLISVGALAGNFISALRNFFEARLQHRISMVYDALVGKMPLALKDFFTTNLFGEDGTVKDPILREVDETAASMGLYQQGRYADIAEYLQIYDRRSKINKLGFGLQGMAEYEANRVTFLKEYRRALLRYAGRPDAREAAFIDGLRAIYRTQGYLSPEGQSQFEYKLNQVPGINILLTLMTTTMRLLYQSVADVASFYKTGAMSEGSGLGGFLKLAGYASVYFLAAGLVRGVTNTQILGDIANLLESAAAIFTDEDESSSGLVRETPAMVLKRKAYEVGQTIGLTAKQIETLASIFSHGWLSTLTDYNMATSSNLSQMGETILSTKGRAVADLITKARKDELDAGEVTRAIATLISPMLSRAIRTAQQAAEGTYYIGSNPIGKPFTAYDIVPFLAMGLPYSITSQNDILQTGAPVFGGLRERKEFLNKLLLIRGITLRRTAPIYDSWEYAVLHDEEFARKLWVRLIDNYHRVWGGRPNAIKRKLTQQLTDYYEKYYSQLRLSGVTPDKDLRQTKRAIEIAISDVLLAKAFLTTMYYDKEFWKRTRIPPPVFPIVYKVAGIVRTTNPDTIDRYLETIVGSKFMKMLRRKMMGSTEQLTDAEIRALARAMNQQIGESIDIPAYPPDYVEEE